MDEISPVLNGLKFKSNDSPESQPLQPHRKNEKWIKFDGPDLEEISIKRKYSLDKREAQSLGLNRLNIDNKPKPEANYETTQVKER